MREIFFAIQEAFSGIAVNVVTALNNDLLFPHQPQTLEEKLFSKMKGQSSLLNSQQNRLVYQAGVIRDQSQELRDRENLLTQKDKEIQSLNNTVRSLEFRLRESPRQERRR